jgi:hypothetical protein
VMYKSKYRRLSSYSGRAFETWRNPR